MKNKIKFVSVCATALMAIAPAITPLTSVVHADEAPANNQSAPAKTDSNASASAETDTTSKADQNTQTGTIEIANVTVPSGTPSFVPSATANSVKLSGFPDGFKVNKFENVANIYKSKDDATKVIKNNQADASATVKDTDKLEDGKVYYEVAELTLTAPKPNTKYSINNGIETKDYTSDANSSVTVPVVYELHAKASSNYGQPFFVDAQNTPYQNGQTINASETIKDTSDKTGSSVLSPTSVKNIVSIINGMNLRAYDSSNSSTNALQEVTEDDVKTQLQKAGITPNSDGEVQLPASGFTYTLTVTNQDTKNKATLNIFFKAPQANYSAYPLIKFGKVNVMQGGNNFNESPVATVSLHDKNWRQDVLKQFSASQSSANNASIQIQDSDLTVTGLDINHTGLYPATIKVTNEDGRATYLAFNIGVQGDAKDETKTKIAVNKSDYTAKSINAYSIDGEKVEPLKDKTFPINSQVTVYNDEQTVKGVRYARVVNSGTDRDKTNEWVRTDQLSDTPETPEAQSVVKKLMHASYLYNAKGKRVGKTVLRSYSTVPVVYKRVTIGKHEFYKLAHSENYIKCGNIDATIRKVNAKAYIYNNKGQIVTAKKTVTVKKNGKNVKVPQKVRLFYTNKTKNNMIKTYGARFTIKTKIGKKTSTRKFYRVGENRYVESSKLSKAVNIKATNEAVKNDADKTVSPATPTQTEELNNQQ